MLSFGEFLRSYRSELEYKTRDEFISKFFRPHGISITTSYFQMIEEGVRLPATQKALAICSCLPDKKKQREAFILYLKEKSSTSENPELVASFLNNLFSDQLKGLKRIQDGKTVYESDSAAFQLTRLQMTQLTKSKELFGAHLKIVLNEKIKRTEANKDLFGTLTNMGLAFKRKNFYHPINENISPPSQHHSNPLIKRLSNQYVYSLFNFLSPIRSKECIDKKNIFKCRMLNVNPKRFFLIRKKIFEFLSFIDSEEVSHGHPVFISVGMNRDIMQTIDEEIKIED